MESSVPSESEVLEYMESLKNWGVWGDEDELGTLNLITPEKRVEAAGLVSDGITVSCARPVTTDIDADTTYQVVRHMVDSGEGRDSDPPERALTRRGAAEFLGMVFHGRTVTHVDSLCHYSWSGEMYNGIPANRVTSREGAQALSVEAAHRGIVSRGVLLDVSAARGVDWLEPGEGVMPEDLDAAERAAGVTVEPGDIVLVRTGNYRRRLELGPWDPESEGMTACHVACAPWFHQRRIAMLGTDTPNDVRPNPYQSFSSPFHTVALVAMGLWLIDNCDLEGLAEACAQRSRFEFLATVNPLRLRNVTGSPVSPVAIF